MENRNYKTRIILLLKVLAIAGLIFLLLYISGQVQYGERVSIVDSNDYYMNLTARNINSSNTYQQTFKYSGDKLYSIKLSYAISAETPQMNWYIQLYNDGELVQQWDEKYENLSTGGVREYIVDNPQSECESENYSIIVKTNYEGESGVNLYGSDYSSYTGGELYIGEEKQEGDITIIISEIVNVTITLLYAILISLVVSGCIVLGIYKKVHIRIANMIKKCITYASENKKEIISVVSVLLVSYIIFFFVKKFVSVGFLGFNRFNIYIYAFLIVIALNGSLMVIFRKYLSEKPEIILGFTILVIGVLYIYVLPGDAEISWDEAIHFWRAIGVSNATTGMANEAESILYWKAGIPFGLPNSIQNLTSSYQMIENVYQQNNMTCADIDILTWMLGIAYTPAAIFIKIGKLLGFKLWQVFKLGLLGTLFVYVANVYFAMKKVTSGKMIVATVSCIGTAFFLATVYSTDSWIVGFSILGFSYFISCLKKKEPIENKELVVIVLALTIAFIPKAVYFPMLLLLLFLPRKKFTSEKQYQKYVSAVLASTTFLAMGILSYHIILVLLWWPLYLLYRAVVKVVLRMNNKQRILLFAVCFLLLVVIAYFMLNNVLPRLVGEGDMRGGDAVNAPEQIKSIVSNPMKYIYILKEFLFGHYLRYKTSIQILFEQYGYLGASGFHFVGAILVATACLTDKDKKDCFKGSNVIRITTIGTTLLAIVLTASALYVAFTPVGHSTVFGCQPRYLLPLIYPTLAVLGTGRFVNPIKKVYYNAVMIIGINGYLLANIWVLAVTRYTL